MTWKIIVGSCVERMRTLPEASVHAIVTDPPYGLEFMGKDWDRLDAWRDGGGFSRPGIGDRPTAWTSYGGETANPSCRTCGGRARGARKCACPEPDWHVRGEDYHPGQGDRARARRMQDWHEAWAREALRVLRPGGHLLAFGGTRTYHRLACAVEDAGFEIRDSILSISGGGDANTDPSSGHLAWLYGSGRSLPEVAGRQ
jgi:DNA modification methylase